MLRKINLALIILFSLTLIATVQNQGETCSAGPCECIYDGFHYAVWIHVSLTWTCPPGYACYGDCYTNAAVVHCIKMSPYEDQYKMNPCPPAPAYDDSYEWWLI